MWKIISGSQFIDPDNSDLADGAVSTNQSIRLTALADPGAVEIEARVTADGEQCVRTHTLRIVRLDLDIDSDNNNGYDLPDRSEEEDEAEDDESGKVVLSNTHNLDDDVIPDFVDGYGFFPALDSNDLSDGVRFTPLVLELDGLDAGAVLRLSYDDSDPFNDVAFTSGGWQISGSARLWLKDGSESRDGRCILEGGDYIPSGEYTLNDLGLTSSGDITIYIETLVESNAPGDLQITVWADPTGDSGFIVSDTVRVTSVRVEFYTIDEESGLELRAPALLPSQEYDANAHEQPWPEVIEFVHRPNLHEARVYDPRDLTGIDFEIGNDALTLFPAGDHWVTERFWIDAPPHVAVPAVAPVASKARRVVLFGGNVEWSYNPMGPAKTIEVPPASETDKMFQAAQEAAIDEMEADISWRAMYPNDSDGAAFGKEVHRRMALRMHGTNQWLASVWVRTDTLEVVAINPSTTPPQGVPSSLVGEMDLVRLKSGASLNVGDTFSVSIIQDGRAVYEIKTSAAGSISSTQAQKYTLFTGSSNNFRISTPTRRFQSGAFIAHAKGGKLFKINKLFTAAPFIGTALTIAFPANAEAAQRGMFEAFDTFVGSVCDGDYAGATADFFIFFDAMNLYLSLTSGQQIPGVSQVVASHAVSRAVSKKEEFTQTGILPP